MSAATMDAPVSTVMDLAGRRINKVEHQIHRATIKGMVERALGSLLGAFVVWMFNRMTVKFTDDAIWFKGASKEAWSDNSDVRESMADILPRLDRLKADLMSIREEMLALPGESVTPGVRAAKVRAIASVTDLYESVAEFRWTLLELEANHSPSEDGFFADTPEGVTNLFRRLEQGA